MYFIIGGKGVVRIGQPMQPNHLLRANSLPITAMLVERWAGTPASCPLVAAVALHMKECVLRV